MLVEEGVVFNLKSIAFHAGSEHLIQGVRFPLEMQFIHEIDQESIPDGYLQQTLILSVLFDSTIDIENQFLTSLNIDTLTVLFYF
jgi:carbonic anhydrase